MQPIVLAPARSGRSLVLPARAASLLLATLLLLVSTAALAPAPAGGTDGPRAAPFRWRALDRDLA
jgi:hypothetical protein